MELIFDLFRHGSVGDGQTRPYIGSTDLPLSPRGRAELAEQWEGTAVPSVDMLFSSPMRRCRETAELLFPGRAPVYLDELREIDFGFLEGRTADELADNKAYREWVEGGCQGRCPGGEDVSAFKERCCRAFRLIWEDARAGTGRANTTGKETGAYGTGGPTGAHGADDTPAVSVGIVAHGGVLRAVLERYARPPHGFYDYEAPNGCCWRCRAADGGLFLTAELLRPAHHSGEATY